MVSVLVAATCLALVAIAPGQSRATDLTTLVSFCSSANCVDGSNPAGKLVADENGNLFGMTIFGGTGNFNGGTVFEIANGGFVVRPTFAGTPGQPNCHGESVSVLARQYNGVAAAAAALGFSSVQALQNAISTYCAA